MRRCCSATRRAGLLSPLGPLCCVLWSLQDAEDLARYADVWLHSPAEMPNQVLQRAWSLSRCQVVKLNEQMQTWVPNASDQLLLLLETNSVANYLWSLGQSAGGLRLTQLLSTYLESYEMPPDLRNILLAVLNDCSKGLCILRLGEFLTISPRQVNDLTLWFLEDICVKLDAENSVAASQGFTAANARAYATLFPEYSKESIRMTMAAFMGQAVRTDLPAPAVVNGSSFVPEYNWLATRNKRTEPQSYAQWIQNQQQSVIIAGLLIKHGLVYSCLIPKSEALLNALNVCGRVFEKNLISCGLDLRLLIWEQFHIILRNPGHNDFYFGTRPHNPMPPCYTVEMLIHSPPEFLQSLKHIGIVPALVKKLAAPMSSPDLAPTPWCKRHPTAAAILDIINLNPTEKQAVLEETQWRRPSDAFKLLKINNTPLEPSNITPPERIIEMSADWLQTEIGSRWYNLQLGLQQSQGVSEAQTSVLLNQINNATASQTMPGIASSLQPPRSQKVYPSSEQLPSAADVPQSIPPAVDPLLSRTDEAGRDPEAPIPAAQPLPPASQM